MIIFRSTLCSLILDFNINQFSTRASIIIQNVNIYFFPNRNFNGAEFTRKNPNKLFRTIERHKYLNSSINQTMQGFASLGRNKGQDRDRARLLRSAWDRQATTTV